MDSFAHRRALQVGRAAEHLVVASLLLAGHEAFLTEAGMPYDIVVEAGGRLLRVQVKSTAAVRNGNSQGKTPRMAYVWNVRSAGRNGRKRLEDHMGDLVALVALDIRAVAFLPVRLCPSTVILDPPGGLGQRQTLNGKRFTKQLWEGDVTQYPLEQAICAL